MRLFRLHPFLLSAVTLVVLTSPLQAQISQPFNGDQAVVVTPVAPSAPVTATIDIFSQCQAPLGPSLLKPGTQNFVSGADPVPLVLAAKLSSGASVCAIETFAGSGAPASHTFQTVYVGVIRPASTPAAPVDLVIEPAIESQLFLLVDPIPPPTGNIATLDVFPKCPIKGGEDEKSLLLPGSQHTVAGSIPVTLALAKPLKNGDKLCAVETFTGVAASSTATAAVPLNATDTTAVPASPATPPSASDLEKEDSLIRAMEAPCVIERNNDCLAALTHQYLDFFKKADSAVTAVPSTQPSSGQNWFNDYVRLKQWNITAAAAAVDAAVALRKPIIPTHPCRSFAPQAPVPAGADVFNQGCFAFRLGDLTGNVAHARIIAGIDVSAASSADPAAKFLFESTLDIPLPIRHWNSPIYARNWLSGYARIGSVAQPGPVSGIASLSSYVSSLTASAPNQIVQSFEASAGYEYRIHTFNDNWGRRPILLSFLANGGLITPISNSQNGTPAVYVATPALQSYYVSLASSTPTTVNQQNAANITNACAPATSGGTAPACYITQFAQDRQHFFRDYYAGLRVKRYYYNEANASFIFPAVFDFTVGQNEYVTGGELRRWVSHFGGSTPVAGIPGLYAYAVFDLVLTKNAIQGQQFSLQTAGSAITPASPNVAQIFVVQPDRDRYRFGIAYDISKVIGLATKYPPKTP